MLCVLRCPACNLHVAVDATEAAAVTCPRCESSLEGAEAGHDETPDRDDSTVEG